MSQIIEHVEIPETVVPARKEARVIGHACDLCGRNLCQGNTRHNVSEVVVSCERGQNFGSDGGDLETIEFDVCETCFRFHIVGYFNSRGIEPRTTKRNW